jgi:hypothetical protein
MLVKLNLFAWRCFLLFGVLLFAATLWAGYEWFYVMSPWRRSCYCWWKSNHWEEASTREYEEAIKRGKDEHNPGSILARYGDRSTVDWIMEDLKPGGNVGCPSHFYRALGYQTNHWLGDESDDWIAWWEDNKDKTQEEWILDGFERIGISLSEELTEEDTVILLTLLGGGGVKQPLPENHGYPPNYHFNAYRWLRDHDFYSPRFEYETVVNADQPEAVLRGLLKYESNVWGYPKDFPLSKSPEKYEPPSSLKWNWAADAGIPLTFCLSVLLINVSRGRVKKWKALKITPAESTAQEE